MSQLFMFGMVSGDRKSKFLKCHDVYLQHGNVTRALYIIPLIFIWIIRWRISYIICYMVFFGDNMGNISYLNSKKADYQNFSTVYTTYLKIKL